MRREGWVLVALVLMLAGCSPAFPIVRPAARPTPSPATASPTQTPAVRGGVQHPAPGTAERKAILDGLRPAVEAELGQKVVFVVDAINVQDGFAFLAGIPRTASGGKIDYSKTRYLAEAGIMDGGSDAPIYAALKFTGARWKVLTFEIGPTDVAYADWWRRFGAPKAIFPQNE